MSALSNRDLAAVIKRVEVAVYMATRRGLDLRSAAPARLRIRMHEQRVREMGRKAVR